MLHHSNLDPLRFFGHYFKHRWSWFVNVLLWIFESMFTVEFGLKFFFILSIQFYSPSYTNLIKTCQRVCLFFYSLKDHLVLEGLV